MSFLCWHITLNFVFWTPNLTLHVKYKYILTIIWFYIIILCIHAFYHINMNNLCEIHIFKIHNFWGQKHFWAKCAQMGYIKKIQFKSFCRLIINVKILSNFQKEWCTFGRKERDYPLLRFECFEYAKTFLICVEFWACKLWNQWKIVQKNYDNPNYYVSFVVFQTYKTVVLKNVHSLRWLLWLFFIPMSYKDKHKFTLKDINK